MYLCTLDLRWRAKFAHWRIRRSDFRIEEKTRQGGRAPLLCIEVNFLGKLFVHNGATQSNIQHFDLIFSNCLKKTVLFIQHYSS